MQSSISLGLIPVRASISFTTVDPNFAVEVSFNVPPKEPIAVLKGSQITIFCIDLPPGGFRAGMKRLFLHITLRKSYIKLIISILIVPFPLGDLLSNNLRRPVKIV